MKLYLDLCCQNRPFYDQSQARIALEADAITKIMEACALGHHTWWTSVALEAENRQTPNEERRGKIELMLAAANGRIDHIEGVRDRVVVLERFGFQPFDAFHLATAEAALCDRLVTTNDDFVKIAIRNQANLMTKVVNPTTLVFDEEF
jgi:predicted nucleic acid-binding protein